MLCFICLRSNNRTKNPKILAGAMATYGGARTQNPKILAGVMATYGWGHGAAQCRMNSVKTWDNSIYSGQRPMWLKDTPNP